MKVLTVATRGGKLAIAQTEIVSSLLKRAYPDLQIEIKKVTTKGDKDKRTALWNLKTSGFFTSQVEDALLASEADFAVHSFKDLPTAGRKGIAVAAVCDRRFVEDCLIAADSVDSIEQLRPSARIGTSSLRRAAQLKRLRKDLEPTSIRGNVLTRLRRLEEGKYDAIILARAGMERLGLAEKISLCFDPRQFIPAPAQGALAVQTRSDNITTNKLITTIDDKKVSTITSVERQVLVTMRCGCHAPVGVFAEINGDNIRIYAFISNLDGENFIRREITGPANEADKLAEQIAKDMLESGGREILETLQRWREK